jgi:hypothetical protein
VLSQTTPPDIDFFKAPREAFGTETVCLRLGPLEIILDGLNAELAEKTFERYVPYSVRDAGTADGLRLRVAHEPRDYFLQPPETIERVRVFLASEGHTVRYVSYRIAARFDTVSRQGDVLLSDGEWEPYGRSLENVIRAAVAWQAATQGGMLVHAASAILNGRGYLFYGESGAGKSTLSACNRRAQIVSDDLSLLLPDENGQLMLIGSPFRGTYEEGDPVVGQAPLAAGFRLIQASEAEVRPVNRIRAFAELVGNLPFLADSFASRPDLFKQVDDTLTSIPLAHLHFSKDDSYWDAILAAGY